MIEPVFKACDKVRDTVTGHIVTVLFYFPPNELLGEKFGRYYVTDGPLRFGNRADYFEAVEA